MFGLELSLLAMVQTSQSFLKPYSQQGAIKRGSVMQMDRRAQILYISKAYFVYNKNVERTRNRLLRNILIETFRRESRRKKKEGKPFMFVHNPNFLFVPTPLRLMFCAI